MSRSLTPKQSLFVKNISKGFNQEQSAKLAGYSDKSAYSIASVLMKNIKIIKALDRVGLTDKAIAKGIKTNVEKGMGVKATASDSLRGLELASKLKGYMDREPAPQSLTQTNIYIRELQQLSDKELSSKVEALTKEVKKLKA